MRIVIEIDGKPVLAEQVSADAESTRDASSAPPPDLLRIAAARGALSAGVAAFRRRPEDRVDFVDNATNRAIVATGASEATHDAGRALALARSAVPVAAERGRKKGSKRRGVKKR